MLEAPPSSTRPWARFVPWLGLLCLLLAVPAPAADEALLDRVRAFLTDEARALGDAPRITLHPPAAHFPACESPRPFLPKASRPPLGRVSVGVRCGEAGRRTRYLQAEVAVVGTYLETARAIGAGERLGRRDLVERRGDLGRLPRQALRDLDAAIGQVARRSLAGGQVVQAHQLRLPRLVGRGDRVRLEARGEGFRVTRQGEALEAGGRGERIRVRLADRRILEARIIGPQRLVVDN
ncbi:flagellar basal body P-ring formation chaperone FlgA [Halomonas nitroreducens]|uniref:Flagella basal body P-ring formation protein FlgA n=1 Tax=Halomonas nitroreducens TaxID=447425 RepID=A0A431V5S8_9GAMM|nr:flagellar basal body P-ring formation chaperone FlgA [Halomonas nitroreducens]RTR04381.1 flagellar basal body P-ring formation protein FlgA [Halomonas nitroreducens]